MISTSILMYMSSTIRSLTQHSAGVRLLNRSYRHCLTRTASISTLQSGCTYMSPISGSASAIPCLRCYITSVN